MNNKIDVRRDTLSGIKWSFFRQISSQIITFGLGVILARILSPSDYGIVGMVAFFFAVAQILIDSGLSTALIRKTDLKNIDKSTIFYFNIIVSVLCAAILCLLSEKIANFLEEPILTDMVKVSAISMVIGSFGSVQIALMTRDVNFKTPALLSIPAQIISGLLGVFLAYQGCGAWSIVWQSFTNTLINTIGIWIISPWRPLYSFSFSSLRNMFSFASNIAVNAVLDCFFNEGMGLLIAKIYTPSQLGYFSKANQTAQLPSKTIFNLIGNVTLPVLSKLQDDDESLMHVYRKMIKMSSLAICFTMLFIASVSKPLIIFLFTEKWLLAVPLLQILSIKATLYHIHAINWNLLMVKGRSDWALKKELINKSISIIVLLIGLYLGVIYYCYALLAASIFNVFVNCTVSGYLFRLGLLKQLSDFFPYFLLSLISCLPSWYISSQNINPFISLIFSFAISAILYITFLYLKKDEAFLEYINITPLRSIIKSSPKI